MFKKIKTKESLQDILSVFSQTKQKLVNFIEDGVVKDAEIQVEINELQKDLKENNKELDKARNTLTQINNILGE